MPRKRLRERSPPPQPAAPPKAAILIVDDDERNAFAAVQALEDLGHELVVARSGEEALRHLLYREFAVILLDLHMPGMDGYETAGLIRARKKNSGTPIVFLTAIFRDEAHVFQAYSAGAVDMVFKPVDPFILRSKVSVLVDLYLKTQEIKLRMAEAERLLDENARAMADKLVAERALKRSREREDAILRSLPVVFHSRRAEPPFAVSFISGSVKAITGFDPDRFLDEETFGASRIHPDDLQRVIDTVSATTTTGSYSCEFRWLCADGQYRYLMDTGVLAPADDAGGEREIFGVILDSTDRRSLEEQLAQARKMEAVGQLTGGVAHDFNNLLTVVLGNIDMLTGRIEDETRRARRIDAMRQAAERGRDLTYQLLAFSRRQHLTPVTLDANQLIHDFAPLMRQAVGESVTLRLELAPNALPVSVDRTQLETALLNLAVNARDAMPEGGDITFITGREPDLEIDDVVIEVRDTGSGMSEQVKDRVFEPFYTTKEVGKGSGLGLSQVYGFVSQSSGRVTLASEVGKGTSVVLRLPLSMAVPETLERPAASKDVVGGDERVLVVEDEASVRDLTVEMLTGLGYTVVTAASAAEAMERLVADARIDVLFSDVVMPGGASGVTLARQARKLRPDLPVLLTSGYVAEPGLMRGGEYPLIDKPYDLAGLAGRLRAVLATPAPGARRRSVRRKAAAAPTASAGASA